MVKIKFNKKITLIISHILVLIIGVAIGACLIWGVDKYQASKEDNKKEVETTNPLDIKESPYTLEELYEIVEDPERFYQENGSIMTYYNIVMFHFYDYFSKSTPVKVATKVEVDDHFKVSKVLEVKYIDYYEYQKWMDDCGAYKFEKEFIENDYGPFNYKRYIEDLIYSTKLEDYKSTHPDAYKKIMNER